MKLSNKNIKETARGLASSIRLLTNLPCPGNDAERIESCRIWFPLVGLLLGYMVVAAGLLLNFIIHGWNELTAFIMVTLSTWLTRGFHLDGLSDCADGFWGGFTPEKRLTIMKDSAVGAFGSIAMILIILGKLIAYSKLIDLEEWHWIIIAFIISRTMQVLLAGTQPYARPNSGTGADFIKNTHPKDTIPVLLFMMLIIIIINGLNLRIIVIPVFSILLTFALGTLARRRINGITGDVLGAVNEINELFVLIIAAIFAEGRI